MTTASRAKAARGAPVAGFRPAIGDGAVRAKTGKDWEQWFAILDRDGAASMTHAKMARWLSDEQGVGPWWCQMIANTYEQARGLRKKHETAEGWQVGGSRTVDVPLERLFAAWSDATRRARWLGAAPLDVRRVTKDRSMRMVWEGGTSRVDANFYARGANRSQVQVDHAKLASESEAKRMKVWWAERLDRMKKLLEG